MDRTANDGKKMNPQTDLLPLYALESETVDFYSQIAQAAGVEKDDILSDDLFLYNRQKGTILGADKEFVASPKLDDLQCVFAALQGFLSAKEEKSVPVPALPAGNVSRQQERNIFHLRDSWFVSIMLIHRMRVLWKRLDVLRGVFPVKSTAEMRMI